MSTPPASVSSADSPIVSQILPTGISLMTLVNETLRVSFRYDRTPTVDLPSLWRLAKHVVYERGPLIVSRYKEQA